MQSEKSYYQHLNGLAHKVVHEKKCLETGASPKFLKCLYCIRKTK